MSGQSELITCEIDADGVALVRLNRPEKANCFNMTMIAACVTLVGRLTADDAVKVIVLTGVGRVFCAGGDIDELEEVTKAGPPRTAPYLRDIQRVPLAFERCDKPVIAAVNGAARGAGMDVAMMCDLRIAGASANFAQSYIDLAVIPGDGGAWLLPRLIGLAKSLEMIWTGAPISAQEAERIGLVNRVVPDAELLDASLDMARRIAAQPTAAIRMGKRAAIHGLTATLSGHLDAVSSHMAVLYEHPDFRSRLANLQTRLKARAKPAS
jgi:enoyl-CoA hydratase/carnithine racemase